VLAGLLGAKQLGLLRELMPNVTVAVLTTSPTRILVASRLTAGALEFDGWCLGI
jgi:hypothetical protein